MGVCAMAACICIWRDRRMELSTQTLRKLPYCLRPSAEAIDALARERAKVIERARRERR